MFSVYNITHKKGKKRRGVGGRWGGGGGGGGGGGVKSALFKMDRENKAGYIFFKFNV